MPRIIRSTGVNIERAHPIVVTRKGQPRAEAPVSAPVHAAPEPVQQQDTEKIKASAEFIVEEILARARNDADNMLVNARAETMRVLQDAVREGREQGLEEVRAQWEDLRLLVDEELEGALEALRAEQERIIAGLERDMLSLVFDIVDKVLAVEMERSDAWVESLIKEALRHLEGDETMAVRVCTDAKRRVADAAERLMLVEGKSHASLNIQADGSLPPGGCVIETGRGSIGNGVETKLDKLKTILVENA